MDKICTMTKFETLSDRLIFALDQSKMRKIDLARAVGVSPQVIHRLCNSKTHSTRFAYDLAKTLGVNLKWLTSGEGPAYSNQNESQNYLNNLTAIPVLEKSVINSFINNNEFEHHGDNFLYTKCKVNNAFALIMPDSSMEPVIKKNSIMAFQKQQQDVNNNDIVLIHLDKFDEYFVRRYVIDEQSNAITFKPYNTDIYKPISSTDAKIIGRLIAYHWEE